MSRELSFADTADHRSTSMFVRRTETTCDEPNSVNELSARVLCRNLAINLGVRELVLGVGEGRVPAQGAFSTRSGTRICRAGTLAVLHPLLRRGPRAGTWWGLRDVVALGLLVASTERSPAGTWWEFADFRRSEQAICMVLRGVGVRPNTIEALIIA